MIYYGRYIPKSSKKHRMVENAAVVDIALDAEDLAALDGLTTFVRSFVRSFVRACVRLFVRACVRPSVRSQIRLLFLFCGVHVFALANMCQCIKHVLSNIDTSSSSSSSMATTACNVIMLMMSCVFCERCVCVCV